MPEVAKFDVGDKVMAKWPGSPLYFEGEVEDMNDIEYLIKFNDEEQSKLTVKYREVVTLEYFRSTRSASRGRSPARTKGSSSIGKGGKAASKSPGRKPKAETKTNVSKTSSKGSRGGSKSPSRSIPKANSSSSSSSTITSTAFSVLDTKAENDIKSDLPVRQSARIATTMEKTNDVKSTVSSITSSSIRTTTINSSRNSTGRFAKFKSSVGYGLRVMWSVVYPVLQTLPLIAFLVALPLLLTQACTKKKCIITEFPDLPIKLGSYYEPKAVGLVIATLFLHVLLAFVPLKSKVLPNGAKARGNGLFALLVVGLLLLLAMYLQYNVQVIYSWVRQLLVTYTVLGVVLSFLLYVKSYYSFRSQRNPRTTGHFLPDLVEGREVSPRIFSLDIKSFIFRHVMINMIVFNTVLILRDVQLSKGGYSPILIMTCALQMLYCVNFLVFEDCYYTTWEYTRQGTGMLVTVGYFTLPFIFAVYTRLVMNYRTEMPWYCLVGIGLLFLVGCVLVRGSGNQKHAFRTNPSSPQLAHLESVPTSAGSRLLVSGWWGVIRHPNYVGEMLMQFAVAFLCGFGHGLPWALMGISTVYALVRVYQVEKCCSEKYGLSWTNYTGRVKYRLVPKIF